MTSSNAALWNQLAADVARPDADGRFICLPNARSRVTNKLLEHARKSTLPHLVRGYFEVAFELDQRGVREAVGAILCGIADAQPLLPRLDAETFEAIEAETRERLGVQVERRAPTYDATAPRGSIKLSSFLKNVRTL